MLNLQLVNTKRFHYRLTGTGWAEVTFVNENQSITFEVSYLSDPLSDLFEALLRLKNKQTTFEKVVFADEPGEHHLVLTKGVDDTLKIKIFWCEEWEEIAIIPSQITDKKLVYTDSDKLDKFILTVCVGIADLLDETSIIDYNKRWNLFEFPLDTYNKLRLTIRHMA